MAELTNEQKKAWAKTLYTRETLTQAEIAEVLHCKREVYRRYEKGIHEIPTWAVIELAKYYGTTTDYILGLTDKR